MEEAEERSDKDTVLLVDEADKLFVDDKKNPPVNCKAIIGFTATIPSGAEGGYIEKRLKDKLNFLICDNFGYPPDEMKLDGEVQGFEDFFKASTRGAKLV